MSPKGQDAGRPTWLTPKQQRAWLAYMRVQLRMAYEMNRQLQADSDLSLGDYDVLNALSDSPDARMRIKGLAARIGWERTRLGHHVRRMSQRNLVNITAADNDRRATEVTATDEGLRLLTHAAPGHVDLVRTLFFDGLPDDLLAPLTDALEAIYDNVVKCGSLPRPQ